MEQYDRSQFTFFASFYEAISKIRKKADRADAYDTICAYALCAQEPELDKLPDAAQVVFLLAKPNLDSSRRKAKSGKAGGGKQKANDKQTESSTEAQKKNEENASSKPKETGASDRAEAPKDAPARSVSVDYFLRNLNSNASGECLRELLEFERQLGAEVCCYALRLAQDIGVRSWSYSRAILQSYVDEGIKTVDDCKQREANKQARKSFNKAGGKTTLGESKTLGEAEKKAVQRALKELEDA